VLLYRQIDVHCYNHKHSGSWVTTLPRSTNSSNGTASYTLPPHLLATDTVTLCVVRGCYNVFGDIFKHLTNTITISCSLSGTHNIIRTRVFILYMWYTYIHCSSL
jgi:hypothetical protein